MELEKSSEPGAECTVDLVTTKGGESRPNPRRMPRSSHCCESRALLVGLGIAFVIYTLLSTLLALALVLEARSENRELRAKLEEQKVLLATILNYATGSGDMGEEENEAEIAKVAVGLGTKKSSNSGSDQYRLLAGSLLTESEEANLNGDIADETGAGAGAGSEGRKSGTSSAGGEATRPSAIPAAGGRRKKRSVNAPIQACDCNNPNATPRSLNGCCCKKRANNAELYNSTTIEKYRQILFGKAAGHFVACNPSQKDLQERRPDGEMIAYNLFRSRNKNIFIGDAEPWSDFPSSRAAFEYDPLQATMTIKQDGLYFVYVQVAHVLFTISTLSVNGAEWLRCQHRPVRDVYDLHSLTTGRESCNMYGVRPLLAGDKIRIQNGVANLVAEVTMSHCSNIGIVKM